MHDMNTNTTMVPQNIFDVRIFKSSAQKVASKQFILYLLPLQ